MVYARVGHWVAILLGCALHASLRFVHVAVCNSHDSAGAILKTILRKGPLPETPIASAKDANGMRSMTHVYCDCDLCTEMIQRCAKIFELRIVSTNKPIASSGAVMIRLV